jgi:pectate lyase
MRSARFLVVGLAFAGLACGRELAQTAYRDPGAEAGDATSCEEVVSELPAAPTWAPAGVSDSPLTSASYAGGDGPGLWISARDAYRVYLNGALLAESKAPRSADFIPLTLLPGENVLAIAVWAATGTPAALVQLDELSRSYVGDASWRVESTPRPGFAEPGYDAASSLAAIEHGRLGSLPGCDPLDGFPAASLARWIGPAIGEGQAAVLRQVIRVAPIGFGERASGGGASQPVLADTWAELEALAGEADAPATILIPEGAYDMRRQGDEIKPRLACPSFCSEEPEKPQYRLLTSSETCPVEQVMMPLDERKLRIGSNKTLVGLGRGAWLRGVSIDFGVRQNIVVRNLGLYDVNRALNEAGDALGFEGTSDVWVDHVSTKWISDGHTDISPGTRNVTLSWMRYDGAAAEACRGRHTHVSEISDATVTLDHVFFDHAGSHAPSVNDAAARVHILNGLVQDNAGYSVAAGCGAEVLLEGTTFRTVATPTARRSCGEPPLAGLISAPPGSNLYLLDVGKHAGGDGAEPRDDVFAPPYEYTVEPAGEASTAVFLRAGAGGPWALPISLDP